MIIMYFGHRFPLTSHIRGHLLSTKMALLHPSTDIPHVGTQKDNLDWSGLNTIDGHDLWCIFLRPALCIFIMDFGLHTWLCAFQLACHMQPFALQPMYACIREFPFSNPCVIHDYVHCNPCVPCIHELPLSNPRVICTFHISILACTLIQN